MRVIVSAVLLIGAALVTSVVMVSLLQPPADTALSEGFGSATFNTYTVIPGDLTTTSAALGRLEANQFAALSLPISGTVGEVRVRVGEQVRAGTVLVTLNAPQQEDAVTQAQLALESARLVLDEVLRGATPEQLENARLAVQGAQGSYTAAATATRPEDITLAEQRVQQAEARVEELRRIRATAPGELFNQQYQLADAALGSATFEAEIARQQLAALRLGNPESVSSAGASIRSAQAALAQLEAGPRAAQVAAAEIGLRRSQVRLAEAEYALSQMQVRAPFAGIITRLDVQPGISISPERIVVELMDTAPPLIVANFDELDIDAVVPGTRAVVRIDALPDQAFDAVVESIGYVSITRPNGAIAYPVRLRFTGEAQPNTMLRPGLTAEIRVQVGGRQNVLVVPNAYIQEQGGAAYVTIVTENGAIVEMPITVGVRGADESEVIAGLVAGDTLAINPVAGTGT